MLELFGSGYVIEHCVSAFLEERKKHLYQEYITTCLRMISENTAKMSGGSYVKVTLDEILHPKPVDTRSAQEIADDLTNRINNG